MAHAVNKLNESKLQLAVSSPMFMYDADFNYVVKFQSFGPYHGVGCTMAYTKEYAETDGEKTLVLIQVGSFFECYALVKKDGTYHGSHIRQFAEINDMTISRKNICVSGQSVVMAGFGVPQLEKYVKKLQENGYVIIVYTQDTQAKNTTRSLNTIFSPGTYFSNDTSNLSNNIMCVWIHDNVDINKIKKLTFGITNIDIFTGKVSIFEYTNDFLHNPTTYDELERYLSIYKPIECILIYNIDTSYINDIINVLEFDSLNLMIKLTGSIIYEIRQIQFNSSHATEECDEHIEVLAANKLLEQKSCPSIYIYNYIVVYCLM